MSVFCKILLFEKNLNEKRNTNVFGPEINREKMSGMTSFVLKSDPYAEQKPKFKILKR